MYRIRKSTDSTVSTAFITLITYAPRQGLFDENPFEGTRDRFCVDSQWRKANGST